MASKRKGFTPDHPIVITFLIFAIIAFMALAAEVLKPLAVALLLSFALAPLCRFLERRGLPRAAAVILTVVLTLGALSAIGFVVGQQLTTLANDLPKFEKNVIKKVSQIQVAKIGPFEKVQKVFTDLSERIEQRDVPKDVTKVSVVSQPALQERFRSAVGPYLEFLGMVAFVLILVLFLLVNREDVGDRLISLFGRNRVSITTRMLEEVGQRISRYLVMFATVNSVIGLIVGVSLHIIGLPYAVLWGVLAAALRFIPYVGPATAFALPFLFSIANAPGDSWMQPMMVAGFFVVLEGLANSVFEPVIYGRTTGVSALGLLIAALFWSWLWGSLGLLLSTPMTVCLAVLGRSVPWLGFFATLLGEESALEPEIRFYHRLISMDQDGATEIVETALKQCPRAEVFDTILIPTLVRTERDRIRDTIDEREEVFIWRVINDLLDELAETPEIDLKTPAPGMAGTCPTGNGITADGLTGRIVGVPVHDRGDTLVLRMLDVLLAPSGCGITILRRTGSHMLLADQMLEDRPRLVILSDLPPQGATAAHYITRRLRARISDMPLFVGRWTGGSDSSEAVAHLKEAGATVVVTRVTDARDLILNQLKPRTAATEGFAEPASSPMPVATATTL